MRGCLRESVMRGTMGEQWVSQRVYYERVC